tara:strand:- start:811 stop:2028 length:1218 start_codon:yes stop_codon:yes gene_type:complete
MEIIFYSFIVLFIAVILASLYYFKKPNTESSIKDLYAEGLDMLVMGKRKIAYKNFKKIVDHDSSNIKAYLHLGQVLREGGNPKKALDIHQNLLLRKNMNNYEKVQLYKNLAQDYYKLDNLEKSIEYCKLITNIENFNDWANKELINLFKQKNDWKNATNYLKIYLKTHNQNDDDKIALYKIQEGRILDLNKDFELSRKLFEESLDLNNNLFICYFFIGNSYASESNEVYNDAITIEENLDGSLEKNEQSQKLKLDAENLLTKSIPMWSHFIENMPEYSWMILPTLKDALQALNRYDDIEDILIRANDKKNNVDLLSHLADFYANKGDINKALNTINKALDNNNNSLIAQLKRLKIISLQNKDNSQSIEIDKLISSLIKDERYIKYKQSYNDKNMHWLFETNNIEE